MPSPPTHQAGHRTGRDPESAFAVRAIPKASTTPPTNHTATRATICTWRADGRRGRNQLRYHSSTQ